MKIGRWHLTAEVGHEWSQFSGDWNWRNFTLFALDFEWSDAAGYKGRYLECHVGLLGLHLRAEIYDVVDRAAALSPVERRLQDFKERHGIDDP